MPNHISCEKRLRQEEKREAGNNYIRKTIRTLSKKMHADMPNEEKKELLSLVFSKLDKAAKVGVIHKRTASRRKARLAQYFNKVLAESQKEEK